MVAEPATKRAVAFFDAQNIYHSARVRFGLPVPNFDPRRLAQSICASHGWECVQTRFYTGIHHPEKNAYWHGFWSRKLAALGSYQDAYVFTKRLLYVTENTYSGAFAPPKQEVAREKGIDVKIALDMVGLARSGEYDVALLFSEDTDLGEAVKEVSKIAAEQGRWVMVACAYPYNAEHRRPGRGIPGTRWIKIEKLIYKSCTDSKDFRLIGKAEDRTASR